MQRCNRNPYTFISIKVDRHGRVETRRGQKKDLLCELRECAGLPSWSEQREAIMTQRVQNGTRSIRIGNKDPDTGIIDSAIIENLDKTAEIVDDDMTECPDLPY